MNDHKNYEGCLSESIKNQIRTSKISIVFIHLAGQLRNSRHWQGYKRKKGPRKGTFDWFRSYSVRSYSPSPGKALFLSLYPVLLSSDIVPRLVE